MARSPVIGQISDLRSVKSALEEIRRYFKEVDKEKSAATSSSTSVYLQSGVDLSSADQGIKESGDIRVVEVTSGSSAHNLVGPATTGRVISVINLDSGNSVTIKTKNGSGITIAAGKAATVYCDSQGNYSRVTEDQAV